MRDLAIENARLRQMLKFAVVRLSGKITVTDEWLTNYVRYELVIREVDGAIVAEAKIKSTHPEKN
jgi:hypothetical protein